VNGDEFLFVGEEMEKRERSNGKRKLVVVAPGKLPYRVD